MLLAVVLSRWQAREMANNSEDYRDESGTKVGHLDLPRAGIVVVVFLVAVLALLAWTKSSATQSPGAAPATTSTTSPATTAPPTTVARANVKVQVANATTKAGSATQITQTLQTQGWNTLPPVNATSQSPNSIVYYAANRKSSGLEIAKELGLPASTVVPLTTSVPVPGSAGDDIVVLVGPNLVAG